MNKILSAALAAALLSACTAQTAPPSSDAAVQLEQQAGLAVNWMQESGEYHALAHHSCNAARTAFDAAKGPAGRKKAVVVDLDETMMDNSAYAAWRIQTNTPFKPDDWTRWVNARQTAAIAGAVDFNNYVNSHGGKMFYVSNRKQDSELAGTLDDMKTLGFQGADEKSLLLKTGKSSKSERFAQIEAQGYDIVLFIGDNLNDFGDEPYHKTNAERRRFVEQNKNKFGTRFIMLPNPTYGDWEPGMAKDYYSLSPEARLEVRRKALRAWNGK